MTVYLDRVFLLNFLVDDLLLLTTARIGGIPLRRGRLALCAVGGALYAAAVFLPGWGWLAHPLLRLGTGFAMSWAAFFPERRLRLTALFLLLSGALAGLLLAIGLATGAPEAYTGRIYRAEIGWPVFLGATGVFYLLIGGLFRRGIRHEGEEIMEVTIYTGEKERTFPALFDTGNTLCDPVSGAAVLVLEQEVLLELMPPPVREILRRRVAPEEKMMRLHELQMGKAFTLLPFRSVGVPAGLLLAFRCDGMRVQGRYYPHPLLALSEGPVSDGGAYRALWGGKERSNRDVVLGKTQKLDTEMEQAV